MCESDGSGCPSTVVFRGHTYTERTDAAFDQDRDRGEELGDGTYPGCRDGRTCDDGPGGFGTDVWRLNGSDPQDAVVGLRHGTHRYVVFARPRAR